MVKNVPIPFRKLSLPFGFEPRMSLVRSCPFYPPNGALNYHEFLENWMLTDKQLPRGGVSDKFILLLVLFCYQQIWGTSICVVMIVPGGY